MGEGERTAFGAGGFRGRCEAVRRLRPRALLAGRARGVGTTVTVHHLEKPVLLDGTLAARFRLCGSPLALRAIAEVQVVLVRGGSGALQAAVLIYSTVYVLTVDYANALAICAASGRKSLYIYIFVKALPTRVHAHTVAQTCQCFAQC